MHFFLITGPPAVGKMTVGQELCKATGFKMFHNHQSLETAYTMFDWGDEEFKRISSGIRELVFDTVSKSTLLEGFIFTLVLDYDMQEDWDELNGLKNQFESQGWDFHIIVLESSQAVRLERNKTPNRLTHKASKRDTKASDIRLKGMDKKHRMNPKSDELEDYSHFRINNDNLSAKEVALAIVNHFNLK